MNGRLFVHVGPPKTATTSLQVALDRLRHGRFLYQGVFQPRDKNRGSFADLLHGAVLHGPGDRFDCALREVRALVRGGGIVMVCEEMFSLQQGELTTDAKIGRLKELLSDVPTTFLATLRDPVEALPSLFQEVQAGLPLPLRMSFARFCADNWAACYDYPRLAATLHGMPVADLRWIDFRTLAEGRLTTADLFGEHDLWSGRPLMLERLNVGESSEDGGIRRLQPVTLRSVARVDAVRAVIGGLGLQGSGLFRWGAALSDRVRVLRGGEVRLAVPKERAETLRAGHRAMLAAMAAPRTAPAAQGADEVR
jgi:hypothetical protein